MNLIKNYKNIVTMHFKNEGNLILVIGKTFGHLDQSIFARDIIRQKKGPPPEVNLFNEKNNGETLQKLIENDLILSAHDVSLGGIITAISKMAIKGRKGFKINQLKFLINKFEYFFGEDQSRYIIEIEPKNLSKTKKILDSSSVHFDEIGSVTANEVIINKEPNLHIDELVECNTKWLKQFMS